MAACSGGEGGGGTTEPARTTGTLSVAVSGLPTATPSAITITGPANFSRTITGSQSLAGLTPGTYEISAAEATSGEHRYGASAPLQTASVTAGATASVSVGYAILTGALTFDFAGLPSGAQPAATLTGPNGFSRTVNAPGSIAGLPPGQYVVSAAPVIAGAHTYAASSPTLSMSVSAGATPVPVAIAYQLASGSLTLTAAGLPQGTSAQVGIFGPNSYQRVASIGDTVDHLAPGTYTLVAAAVAVGADAYRVAQPVEVAISASLTPTSALLPFSLASGRLTVAVAGLPAGLAAAVTVSGPDGYSRAVSATQTLTGLAPGAYTVAAGNVVSSGATYAAAAPSQTVAVTASSVAAQATVAYASASGSLTVTITGLPQAVSSSVTVTGPNAYSATVTTTTTLTQLRPGTYTVTAATAVSGPHRYAPTPATRVVTVSETSGAVTALVSYALATGGIALNVTGLPNGTAGDITVTGPASYSRAVTASSLLLSLTPGTYTVTARLAQSGGSFWSPNPSTQTVTVPASMSAIAATVNYASATGALNVTINGLPSGTAAGVTLTGPGSFSRVVTATQTVTGLLQGTYTVVATSVTSSGTTYAPTAASQNVNVGGGVTSNVIVSYTASTAPPPPPGPLNLTIDGMHVQQVVQSYSGAVPMVAGRDGLLRVFVKASGSNSAAPPVRVRFYSGATLTSTITINAPGASVPTSVTEGTLSSSWNYLIPGSVMQPGLKILADVDPANAVTESSDSDNSFPSSGTAATIDVRTVPTFSLRLVPVLQSANALQGGVTTGNASAYTAESRAVFPLGTVDVDVRAPFTTSAPALQSGDGNGAWSQILSEIDALRAADGSSRYYYGVVKVGYFSGIAGLGYVPGRAAIGWDHLPSASEVMAHELGHNFGRFHAPCGGAGGPDPSYPYSGGIIGVYGYDMGSSTLKAPTTTDLMGYCNNTWISDYTYTAVLNHRASNPFAASKVFASGYARRGLLVWGRVDKGRVILEPTFEVVAPPLLPTRPGRNRIVGTGALGERLFDFSFDGERPADLPDGTAEHFAFVVPIESFRGAVPARIRLSAGGREAELTAASAPTTEAAPTVERLSRTRVRVAWPGATASGAARNGGPGLRGVLVRDARSGQILAFARSGDVVVHTSASDVDLTMSDGVRNVRRRVKVAAPR